MTLLLPELIGPSLVSFDRRMTEFLMSTLDGNYKSQEKMKIQLFDVRDIAKIVVGKVEKDHPQLMNYPR